MAGSDEYLERLFADSFKREVDQDEAIWRSLPFFATSVGLAGALISYVASHLPNLSWDVLPSFLHLLIALALVSLVLAVAWLWVAVRPRRYRYLPKETALLEHATALTAYRARAPIEGLTTEESVASDLRELMIREFAEAASNNRIHNARKQVARTRALLSLMVGTALAATAALAMFGNDRFLSINKGKQSHVPEYAIDSKNIDVAGEAGAAPAAIRR